MIPDVKKTDYQLQFITSDNYLGLMSLTDGTIRQDFKVKDEDLFEKINALYDQVQGKFFKKKF